MNNPMFLFLVVLALYFAYQNYKLIKFNKHYKGFADCAHAVFDHDENADKMIIDYLEKEKEPSFVNKAMIYKLYRDLEAGRLYEDDLATFDPKTLYLDNKGNYAPKKASLNADGFVWAAVLLNKAYALKEDEFIKAFLAKSEPKEMLRTQMEYLLLEAMADFELSINECGVPFFKMLVDGAYEGYNYDKRLIGIYKRIAAFYLSLKGEEIGEFEKEDLTMFAESSVGKIMMEDLGVYDNYHLEETETDETTEDNEVVEETTKEETVKEETATEETNTNEDKEESAE